MSFVLPPPFPPPACTHPRLQVIGTGSQMLHCPACSTFWSPISDIITGQVGDREWTDILEGQLALHPGTERIEAMDGTVLWQRARTA